MTILNMYKVFADISGIFIILVDLFTWSDSMKLASATSVCVYVCVCVCLCVRACVRVSVSLWVAVK